MMHKYMDAGLVARAQAGDNLACEDLLRRLQPVLRMYFTNRIGRKATVDDLVQNTLLRVHSGLAVLQHLDRLIPFAMKAARYELYDLYRGRYGAKERVLDPMLLPDRPDSTSNAPDDMLDAERALSMLPAATRRVFALREHGYRYREIAEHMGTTESAIKMQVLRGLRRMRCAMAA